MHIAKAGATINLTNLVQTYNGSPRAISYTTIPAALNVSITYNGDATAPTNAGSYAVIANINDVNYSGSSAGNLSIDKANQVITFAALNGKTLGDSPFAITATASSGLPVNFSVASVLPPSAGTR